MNEHITILSPMVCGSATTAHAPKRWRVPAPNHWSSLRREGLRNQSSVTEAKTVAEPKTITLLSAGRSRSEIGK